MDLIINNRIITADAEDIVKKIQEETNGYYCKDVKRAGENITVTCPFHKDGQESKPACQIYNRTDCENVPFGFFKCFACGEKGQLYTFVAKCLSCTEEQAKDWLIANFSDTYIEHFDTFKDFEETPKKQYLDESILEQYAYIHPYILNRGVSEDVVKTFRVGWNKERNTITFPVWDDVGHLVGITERNITNKHFFIPKGMDKPVYLLNFIKKWGIDRVIVCEGQIDALVCWSRGFPAVALFGASTSDRQLELLSQSGVNHFILMYDNDLAGRHGAIKFMNNIRQDKLITDIKMPVGKDASSCSPEEFYDILRENCTYLAEKS